MNTYSIRKWTNRFFLVMMTSSSILIFTPLVLIFFYLLVNGVGSLSWNFFTQLPKPTGEVGGGMLHAILGTLYLVTLSAIIAIPWGLLGGVLLAEFQASKVSKTVRFVIDLLNGTPSIVTGIFVYTTLVKPLKSFSALSGGIALAIVILPTVVKAVEEILKLIPDEVRHAGLGIGLSRPKMIIHIVLWSSRKNLLPGILLALARSAGETAPLLFTAFGSMYLSFDPTAPMAALPVEIYNYAISPYQDWHELAWTGSLVLIFLVFVLNISSKIIVHGNLKNIFKRVQK